MQELKHFIFVVLILASLIKRKTKKNSVYIKQYLNQSVKEFK